MVPGQPDFGSNQLVEREEGHGICQGIVSKYEKKAVGFSKGTLWP